MNKFLDFGWHNVEATTNIYDTRFINDYVDEHYNELFEDYCESEYSSIVDCQLWDCLTSILEVDETEYYEHEEDLLKEFSKDYIMQKIKEDVENDGFESRLYQDTYWCEEVQERFYSELDEEYNDCINSVESVIEKAVKKWREKIPEGYELEFSKEESHSWAAGRFPSVYFTVSIGDENFTIRICDGHPNGHSSDYQINFHWFEENDFIEDLDILIDNLIENFKGTL